MKYELVLGLEIHMQLKTDMKMFCACKNDPFHSNVNENVCPVCLGLPGAMPVPNKNGITKAQLMAHALGTKLSNTVVFERKNYSYPDLPKSFQLTCPHDPIGIGGEFGYPVDGSSKTVRWREIHLEEDTAKSQHKDGSTWVDYNKSGVPLLEMVTEPDFDSIDDAVAFCKEIQLIARYLGVSDADMEKGHMRLEANISIRKPGEKELPDYRTELKNINSFGFMKKALESELRRQTTALDKNEKLEQETRGYNETTGETFTQRSKEEANDYRYFPEPDIPVIKFSNADIFEITTCEVELPSARRIKLNTTGLKNDQFIDSLVRDNEKYEKYIYLVDKLDKKPNTIAGLVLDSVEYSNKSKEEIEKDQKEKESSKLSSSDDLLPIIDQVISENQQAASDFRGGNENSLQFLIGQVMKNTQGKADASTARKLLIEQLASS